MPRPRASPADLTRFTPPEPAGSARQPAGGRPFAERAADARVLLALVLVGAALRVWQWAAGASLWHDEIAVARNLLALSLGELVTKPLALDQVAPRGFLAVEKLLTVAFGGGERALRIFPLLAGLAGLVLFRRLAERTLRGAAVPLAVALFAIGLAPIRYSAEVKQYGLDATAAIGLALVALDVRARDHSTRRLLLAGALGLVVVWFSQAAAVVMAGLGAALAVAWLMERDRRTLRALLITVPLWAVAALVAVVVGERSMTPGTREFMQSFWRAGFLPLPASAPTALPWLWGRLVEPFADPWTLGYPWAPAFAALMLAGLVRLWRRRRDVALVMAGPLVVTLLAAVAHQYPFRGRLVVYLIPAALVAAAAGAGWLGDLLARRVRFGDAMVVGAALVPGVLALARARIPLQVEDHHAVYGYLREHRRPGDAVHMLIFSQNAAIYYGPRYGLRPGDYHVGACSRDDTRTFIRDLDRFRGRPRVWLLTAGPLAFRAPAAAMRGYLEAIGVRRQEHRVPSDVNAPTVLALYDLSDPVRLRAAASDTFPAPPITFPKPGCRDWGGDPAAIVRSR